ncbi:TonB-dependent receptor [Sphingobium sp. TB-6]|uniref:TonB-dependent receptor n=1 Tax=Sphingobium sp. TB-6 TaxID=2728850 RepID=UPI00146DC892|nr:TonB-dependent receptor [Sphingobium sp. TB-6]NML90652.1 TonB-dependent receptor [Sphingobium sp. TB-6]
MLFLEDNRTVHASSVKWGAALATVLAVAVLAPGQALAQTEKQTAVEGGLQDIVVTARKRVETTQDAPVAINAFSAEQIDRADLTSLEKVAASTPNFSVGRASNGSGAQLNMRGIGSSSTSIGIEQSIAVVVDGVYYGQGRIINEGFFDLARVEVLKGPQALFFGKNATAGVVSITTAKPTSSFEAMARASYEFAGQNLLGEGYVSGPLTDTLGYRVALRASKIYGGYFENRAGSINYVTTDAGAAGFPTSVHTAAPAVRDAPGGNEILGRATLQWDPSDRLTATLTGSTTISKIGNSSYNYVAYACPGGVSSLFAPGQTPPACERDFVNYHNNLPADIAKVFPFAESDGGLDNRYRSYSLTGNIEYRLEDVTLTSVTNYNYNRTRYSCDCDFQSADLTGTWTTEKNNWKAFSQELRVLTSFDSPVNLMVGGLYQSTRRNFDQTIAFAGAENSAASTANRFVAMSKNSHTKGETVALFGQVIWSVLPSVEASAGVRYSHETKKSYFVHPYVNPFFAGLWLPNVRIDADQTFNDWSPEATVRWKPSDDVTIYGAYKTAYKSGGFSNSAILGAQTTVNDLAFNPEKAAGFEGGIKTKLFDNQLRFDVGLFRYTYKNLQVDFFNSPTFAFITLNAGSVITKGVELDLEYAPRALPGLNLRGSLYYDKARYRNFLAPCYAGQTPAQGCTLIGNGGSPFQDLSGKPTSVAPKWTGVIGASYDTSLGNGMKLGLSAEGRYSSSYLASAFANALSRQPRYMTLDASARIGTADDRLELALIGKNLTNRFYVTGAFDAPATGSGTGTAAGVPADQLGFVNMPRTVTLQLTFRY